MKRTLGVGLAAAITIAASLGAVAPASASITGTVEYAYRTPYVYPNGPHAPGHAQGRAAISATFDACSLQGGGPCNWMVQALAVPGGCPAAPWLVAYPSGGWSSEWHVGDGAFSSGEQQMTLGTPNELELDTLCLYVVHAVPGTDGEAFLVHVKSIDPEPAAGVSPASAGSTSPAAETTPAPAAASSGDQPPVAANRPTPLILTRALAKRTVDVRLATSYGSWRKGSRKRVTCEKAAAATYTCAATWRYKHSTNKARLTVRIKRNTAVARYI
ncbi:MAG: hypothetical protein QOG42_1506 [Solirubrobacteraceae bacterium]|nr:hypothetical protein [Solirubrobacteraceae bacterium]